MAAEAEVEGTKKCWPFFDHVAGAELGKPLSQGISFICGTRGLLATCLAKQSISQARTCGDTK
jgi:hypothetical protein